MNAVPSGRRDTIVHEVRLACERGDTPTLRLLLAPFVVAFIDSGGDVIAQTRPVTGVDRVIHELSALVDAAEVSEQQVNGVRALVARRANHVVGIASMDIADDLVTRVWITVSPLKLQRWNS